MADLALYRKYRSGNFSEVVGQDHVVKTLTTALSSGRLRHAYLFTGPRGVGKTSVARLLARALNCTGDPKPCNACTSCTTAINSSLDIVEMDAASNRSIDAVRDLREKVGLAPSLGRFKVYIIDEVHMLTTEAFNALLKTLEEPPPHAVFILATTEAHKLPETIISRTQTFTFKPITHSDIVAQLQKIATSENITVSGEALDIIASAARGGFRDAISLLDQLASSETDSITANSVRDLLGYSNFEEISDLGRAIALYDMAKSLTIAVRLDSSGAQAGMVATQLCVLWRDTLLANAGAMTPNSSVVRELAVLVPASRIAEIIQALLEITRSSWPQLALESALVRLTVPRDRPETSPEHIGAGTPVTEARRVQPTETKILPQTLNTASTSAIVAGPESPASELWPKVLVHIKAQNNSLAALLQMYPVDFTSNEITVKPRFNFHRDLFLKAANRTTIELAVAKVYGRQIKVSARTEESAKVPKRSQPDQSAELVSSALEILGGEIVD